MYNFSLQNCAKGRIMNEFLTKCFEFVLTTASRAYYNEGTETSTGAAANFTFTIGGINREKEAVSTCCDAAVRRDRVCILRQLDEDG